MRSCVNRVLYDLFLSLSSNMYFDVIFDVNRRRCSLFVLLIHRDFYLFLILIRINIVIATIFRRVSKNMSNLQAFFATMFAFSLL